MSAAGQYRPTYATPGCLLSPAADIYRGKSGGNIAEPKHCAGYLPKLAGLSHRAAAKALNERGIKTAAGKAWTSVQVTRVRGRLGLTAI
jgi:hypothetical protein